MLVYCQVVEKKIHHSEIYQVQVVKFVFDLNLFELEVQYPKINIFQIQKKLVEIRKPNCNGHIIMPFR
jgi:hypothetical protein